MQRITTTSAEMTTRPSRHESIDRHGAWPSSASSARPLARFDLSSSHNSEILSPPSSQPPLGLRRPAFPFSPSSSHYHLALATSALNAVEACQSKSGLVANMRSGVRNRSHAPVCEMRKTERLDIRLRLLPSRFVCALPTSKKKGKKQEKDHNFTMRLISSSALRHPRTIPAGNKKKRNDQPGARTQNLLITDWNPVGVQSFVVRRLTIGPTGQFMFGS